MEPSDLEHYDDREHAKAKHLLLLRYVTRYGMILGRNAPELVFVDGFAGPWQSGASDRSDTSFGLSATALKVCAEALRAKFQRQPTMRSLWIEEDVTAFEQLSEFANKESSSRITIVARNSSFQTSIKDIVQFIGETAYAFVFIDPKGYKGLIEPHVLAPLLALERVEVLINYMWDHIKYAFGHSTDSAHYDNLSKLYGDDLPKLMAIQDSAERETAALVAYEQRLRSVAGENAGKRLRVLSYPILSTRGSRYTKYWLVHATHSARGLVTFAEECQKTHEAQDEIFYVANVRRRESESGTADLFADSPPDFQSEKLELKPDTKTWLNAIPNVGDVVTVDTERWADLLEQGRFLPASLQLGLKSLIDQKIVENVDARGKRKTNFVQPKDSERIRRLR